MVYASSDTTFGNGDDVEVARFARTTALAPGRRTRGARRSCCRRRSPAAIYLFVKADGTDAVFEDGVEANNAARAPSSFDVMPIPYADLVVPTVTRARPGGERPGSAR